MESDSKNSVRKWKAVDHHRGSNDLRMDVLRGTRAVWSAKTIVKKAASQLVLSYTEATKIDAHFVQGVNQFFYFMNTRKGPHLKLSAINGCKMGNYRYASLLLCTGNFTKGKRFMDCRTGMPEVDKCWRKIGWSSHEFDLVEEEQYGCNIYQISNTQTLLVGESRGSSSRVNPRISLRIKYLRTKSNIERQFKEKKKKRKKEGKLYKNNSFDVKKKILMGENRKETS
ncbi:hypothetical protein YC2023_062383 [Brassica napus]